MDCVDDDPCTRNETCDTAAAACQWDLLDSDSDDHVPITCGGDDPDDSNPAIHPGAPEICDGMDNDVNGSVDEDPVASDYCGGQACGGGACPGCAAQPDAEGLEASYFPQLIASGAQWSLYQIIAYCAGMEDAETCLAERTASRMGCQDCPFTQQCLGCLHILLACTDQCNCTFGLSTVCHTCVCDSGCVEQFEACAGMPSPVVCN